MKKFLSFILCVALLIVCCHNSVYAAASDPFTLRSGIVFGDTQKKVKDKENDLKLKSEDKSSLTYNGTIDGYKGEASFYFDSDGELSDQINHYLSFDTKEVTEIYTVIKTSCGIQYGDPLSDSLKPFSITGKSLKMAVLTVELSRQGGLSSDIVAYDEWVLFTNDGMIKIEEVLYFIGQAYYVDIGYHFFPVS